MLRNGNAEETQTMSDLPVTYIRIAGKEMNKKMKIYNVLTSLVDDLVENESNFGKFLVKLGTAPFGYRGEWLPLTSSALENVYKTCTQLQGRQHRNNMKTLTNLLNKIETQFDELRRDKTSHRKRLDKYQRIIGEIESSIKSRNTLSVTENINASHVSNISTAGASRESSTSKDNESFINSLKQFVKITPIESMKRLNEKIRELIKELDVMEVQLGSNSKKLSVTQQELIEELGNAMSKLDQIETIRLNNLKEGLNRLYLAEDLLVNRLSEMMTLLMTDISNLDCNSENQKLVESIDNYTNFEISSNNNRQLAALLQCIHVIELNTGNKTNHAAPITDIFMKVTLLIEGLEYFRAIIMRSIAIISDLSDVEKAYSKTIAKVLEKHGYFVSDRRSMHSASYDSNDNTATSVCTGSSTAKSTNGNTTASAAINTTNKSNDLLASIESPTMKLAWETIVNVFSDHSEVHNATAEVFTTQIIANFDAVMKHVDIVKKDLAEKYLLYSKKVDATSTNLQKLGAKLNKVRNSLKDRREAIKQAKDDINTDEVHSAINVEKEDIQDSSTAAITEINASNNSNNSNNSNKYIQGFEKLGTSIRTSKLSVGLGLETAEERVLRIEAKIVALEEEEASLIEQIEDAKTNSLLIVDTLISEVTKSIVTTKELFFHSISETKNVLKGIAIRTVENMESSRKSVILLRASFEAIDVEKDKSHLSEKIRNIGLSSMVNGGEVDPGSAVVVFSPLEIFEPVQSDLIDTERKVLGITKVYYQEVHYKEYGISSHMPKIVDDDDDDNSKLSEMKASDLVTDNLGDIVVVTGIAVSSSATGIATPSRVKAVSPPTSSINSPTAHNSSKVSIAPVTNNADFELAKFGLTTSDRILESYTCAVYPKKSFLIHGRMYITQHYIAFSGWPETRILIRMSSITSIEKMNTLNFIPNAISIKTNDDDYFFASFIDRDPCFKLISSMSELDRGLEEQYGPNMASNNLVFGYQTKRDILQAIGMDLDLDFSGDKTSKPIVSTTIASPIPSTAENAIMTDTTAMSTSALVQPSAATQTLARNHSNVGADAFNNDYVSRSVNAIELNSFFKAHDIISLHEQDMSHAVNDIWNGFWLDSDGYCDFLTSEGDLDIKCDEWSSFNQNVPEDVASITYTHYRKCNYAHPRTTMLMFGPKNAPATQTQYLRLLGDINTDVNSKHKPTKAIILTITQFDQIPLADCFKVCQYWLFEDSEVNSCVVRIGIHIHFIKFTYLKSQVISGSKDELIVLAKKYCVYLDERMAIHKSTLVGKSNSHDQLQLGSNSSEAILPSRRNSNRRLSSGTFNLGHTDTTISPVNPVPVTWRFRIIQAVFIILALVIIFQYLHNYFLKQNISRLTARVDELTVRLIALSKDVKELVNNSNICESKVGEQMQLVNANT